MKKIKILLYVTPCILLIGIYFMMSIARNANIVLYMITFVLLSDIYYWIMYVLINKYINKIKSKLIGRPEIITLCGSTKFKKEFIQTREKFQRRGYIVLGPHVFSKSDDIQLSDREIEILTRVQLNNIAISDKVYIVNPEGYIGDGTWMEIAYATVHEKEMDSLVPLSLGKISPDVNKKIMDIFMKSLRKSI